MCVILFPSGPAAVISEGGFFKCHLNFPKEYPHRPPKMKFLTEIWHPNIDKVGNVCISILHEPGDDRFGYEKAAERWLPVHTVETILISVISMLADPNFESPANVDAAVSRSLLTHNPVDLSPIPAHDSNPLLFPSLPCRRNGATIPRSSSERWPDV